MQHFNIALDLLALKDIGIEFRHILHKIPESSGQEFKTSAFCKEKMQEFGYTITEYQGYTGFIADLNNNSNTTIAFRADMDALKMQDKTQNEHRSTHEGLAHNCGHDAHMAIALLSAKYLSMKKAVLKKNIRFIFQMAEEDMTIPGADKMVELGCMNGVDEVYALHNDASLEYGEVKVNDAIMSSYGTSWALQIKGKAAHGSTPQKGLDAIREGAKILEEMDYIIAKKISPFNPAVFSCGMFRGGSIPNAIADFVEAKGTVRALDKQTDSILKQSFKDIENQSKLRGFETSFSYESYPAVINHAECYKKIVLAAQKIHKIQSMLNSVCAPMTGSEDFSYMIEATKDKKGAMFFLGSGNTKAGICNYLHSNPYYIEDKTVIVGAQMFINLVFE